MISLLCCCGTFYLLTFKKSLPATCAFCNRVGEAMAAALGYNIGPIYSIAHRCGL
jgi:hypothetical protein